MTDTLGQLALICRVALIPSIPGKATSISTTSGSSSDMGRSDPSALLASPTTSMSSQAESKARTPARMRG